MHLTTMARERTVEAMAAGTLNITLMTAFKSRIMNIVANRFAKKLSTHKCPIGQRGREEELTQE